MQGREFSLVSPVSKTNKVDKLYRRGESLGGCFAWGLGRTQFAPTGAKRLFFVVVLGDDEFGQVLLGSI